MPHNKAHEHGLLLRTPTDPGEIEGSWLPSATPQEARASYERLAVTQRVANGDSAVDLVISGKIVASTDST